MLKYLLDENQRGLLWHVIQRHNARGLDVIDVIRVGDPTDLPLRSKDTDILQWCEENDRILITFDKQTMADFALARLKAGQHHPGVFVLRRDNLPIETLNFLVLAAFASESEEWRDGVRYIP